MKRPLLLGLAALLAACSKTPPASWARGGALLDIPRARWVRGDAAIEIVSDGRVLVNGEHKLTIDRGGRVIDPDNEPVALLQTDGNVLGPSDASLGFVGWASASLPGDKNAWLSIAPSGEVVRYAEDGTRSSMGAWVGGCRVSAPAHQTCMLVSHLLGMKLREQRAESPSPFGTPGMSPGVVPGVGIGIGIGL